MQMSQALQTVETLHNSEATCSRCSLTSFTCWHFSASLLHLDGAPKGHQLEMACDQLLQSRLLSLLEQRQYVRLLVEAGFEGYQTAGGIKLRKETLPMDDKNVKLSHKARALICADSGHSSKACMYALLTLLHRT